MELLKMNQFKTLIYFTFFVLTINQCAYRIIDDSKWPTTLDQTNNSVIEVVDLTQCSEYLGIQGCCNKFNNDQQIGSYIKIDAIFGFKGDGCDHCAINLKRFWCQYACSPRQTDFLVVTNPNVSVIDPTDPSKTVNVQKLTLTVEAQTACDLYNSCKRIGFVSSVSALGSPAGFLNFQGHNAVDDALQFIEMNFSYDKTKALAFSDQFPEQYRKRLSTCETKVPTDENNASTLHGFKFNANCSCNTCQAACDTSAGFTYTESSVLQGFNWILVGSTYLVVGVIAAIVTIKRKKDYKKKNL